MRTKRVPCPECGGDGIVRHLGILSDPGVCHLFEDWCPKCKGCRTVEVPMTNADRIREMTDEELAKMLVDTDWCDHCIQLNEAGLCKIMAQEDGPLDGKLYDHCVAGALNWLRQTLKEDTP